MSVSLARQIGRPRRRLDLSGVLLRVVPIVAIPLIWGAIADSQVFGSGLVGPIRSVQTLADQWSTIWFNAQPTLEATLIGALVLVGLAIVGIGLIVLVPGVAPGLTSVSVVVGTLPLIAITPALSLVITRGLQLTITVTVLSGLVPVAAMLSGVARVGARGQNDLGALYAASRPRWWRFVGLWQSVPVIDLGLRATLPACFVGAIVAEWSGATGDRGLGQVMVNALFSYNPPLLWATLVFAALVALALLGLALALAAPLRAALRTGTPASP